MFSVFLYHKKNSGNKETEYNMKARIPRCLSNYKDLMRQEKIKQE